MLTIAYDRFQITPLQTCYNFFLEVLASDLVQRIKKTAISLFVKISESFRSFKKFSKSNLKAFGLISCLTLILVLFIAIIRPGNSKMVPFPNTPQDEQGDKSNSKTTSANPTAKRKLNFNPGD